jgi:hypothetical protein
MIPILCVVAVLALAFWFEATGNAEAQSILCFGATAAFLVVIGINFA